MIKFLAPLLTLTLAGCASTGTMPTAYKDADTGLYGFQGANGVVVIPPKYREVTDFDDQGLARVTSPQGDVQIINKYGQKSDN
jgi:hypothetical protein